MDAPTLREEISTRGLFPEAVSSEDERQISMMFCLQELKRIDEEISRFQIQIDNLVILQSLRQAQLDGLKNK